MDATAMIFPNSTKLANMTPDFYKLLDNQRTTSNDQINLRELFLLCNLTGWEPFFKPCNPTLSETFITIYRINIHVT